MRCIRQYSVKTLLIAISLLCVWLARTVNAVRVAREVTTAILERGGSVQYDWQTSATGEHNGRKVPPTPPWLRRLLGDDYFQTVVGVHFFEIPLIDRDVARIELTTIRFLSFHRTRISDKTIQRIAILSHIKYLGISETDVTDSGMEHVARLVELEVLSVGNVREGSGTVSDKGVRCLRNLPRLSRLYLCGYAITDKCISTLAAMPTLREVQFTSTSVTELGAAELRRALPRCAVSTAVF